MTWAYLDGNAMESIGDYAFAGCSNLVISNIGSNVASIGSKAFADCSTISRLVFSGNAPAIATDAFYGVTAVVETPADNATWTDAVKQNYGGNLTWTVQKGGTYGGLSWSLDDGFLAIDGNAPMTEQNSAADYPWYAFKDEIEMVNIYCSSLSAHALEGYPKLMSVYFGIQLEEIGDRALANCLNLQLVSFEGNAPEIASNAFEGDEISASYPLLDDTWTAQKRQNYGGTIDWYWFISGNYEKNVYWDIADGHLSIYNFEGGIISDAASASDYPWYVYRDSITGVYISAKNVPAHMVEGYPALTSVNINGEVAEVHTRAFANCAKLTNIQFNGNAPVIAADAFYGVTASVETPGDDATWTDTVKQNYGGNLTWREEHQIIDEGEFEGVQWYVTNWNILVIYGEYMNNHSAASSYPWYKYANVIEQVYIEETNVGNNCFSGYPKLSALEFYNNSSIGSNAFRNCSALEEIYFGAESVTPNIASNAFTGVTAIAYYYGDAADGIINKNYGGNLTWKPYADCSVGHSYEDTVTPPTCGTQGYTTHTCSVCGDSYVDSYVPATGLHAYDDHKDAECNVCGEKRTVIPGMIPVYRLYNPYTHEHLLTGGEVEKTALLAAGWSLDGVAWNAPESGAPVYRLYNPYDDWHTYTVDENEKAKMVAAGWTVDGAISCSAPAATGRPIYRLFNPYVKTNFHLFTASIEERDMLVNAGWILEGIAWYAVN